MTNKTTVYLPDELKVGLAREAKRRGCSEAQVIRDAVSAVVQRLKPSAGLFDAEPFADQVDEHLAGFGQR